MVRELQNVLYYRTEIFVLELVQNTMQFNVTQYIMYKHQNKALSTTDLEVKLFLSSITFRIPWTDHKVFLFYPLSCLLSFLSPLCITTFYFSKSTHLQHRNTVFLQTTWLCFFSQSILSCISES